MNTNRERLHFTLGPADAALVYEALEDHAARLHADPSRRRDAHDADDLRSRLGRLMRGKRRGRATAGRPGRPADPVAIAPPVR